MKILTPKGYREVEDEVVEAILPPYKERIITRIRERYSVDDELAILRQRDTKSSEFEEYNHFVESIKEEERARESAIMKESDIYA